MRLVESPQALEHVVSNALLWGVVADLLNGPSSRAEAEAQYAQASCALSRAMSRDVGASSTEWAAYDRARLDRRMERERFLLAAQRFNEDAAYFLRELRRPHFERSPNWANSASLRRGSLTTSMTESRYKSLAVRKPAGRRDGSGRTNNYTATGIALGAAIGVTFGVVLGQVLTGDTGPGMAIGIIVGVAIGAGIGTLVGIAIDSRHLRA